MHYSYVFGMRVRLESGVMMGNAYGPSEITMGSGNQAYFLLGRTHLIISSQPIDFDVWCMKVHLNMEAVHVRATQIFTSGAALQKLSNSQVISIQTENGIS